jgi:hypothetical protein
MATKWEKEFITALLTSPYNLKAYRLKQRDKKHFDAYFYSIFKSYNRNIPLNIGLEFEYDNTYQYYINNRESIINHYKYKCRDLNIGYDGNIPVRACENRLRINVKQFETLYEFLQDMYIHTNNNLGSIHIHIDCRYNNIFKHWPINLNKLDSIKKIPYLYSLLPKLPIKLIEILKKHPNKNHLFDIYFSPYYMNTLCRSNYNTIEYRWIKPSYNYTHVITNITVCSLLTQSIVHTNNKNNSDLPKTLAKKINLTLEIYNKLKYIKP